MQTPSLDESNARAAKVAKTPWRVDLSVLKQRVVEVEYIHPHTLPHGTIAIVTLDNGFALQGWSAPADPANFDVEAGEQYAFEDALRKAWALEAYVMRDAMTGLITVNNPERWEPVDADPAA